MISSKRLCQKENNKNDGKIQLNGRKACTPLLLNEIKDRKMKMVRK
jgi:hypothetical protein